MEGCGTRSAYNRVCGRLRRECRPTVAPLIVRHAGPSGPVRRLCRELPSVPGPPESSERSSKPRRTLRSRSKIRPPTLAKVLEKDSANALIVGPGHEGAPQPRQDSTKTSVCAEPIVPCAPGVNNKWSEWHISQCAASPSHARVMNLQSEIRTFHEEQLWRNLRGRLRQKYRVNVDEDGDVMPLSGHEEGVFSVKIKVLQ